MSPRSAAAAVLTLLAGCRTAPPATRHVVLVTIDTLRADRVGVYGAPSDLTPQLDRIARAGAFAANASSHVPLTRPSHVSILTGLLPWQHGLRDNISPGDVPDVPLLAEAFKAQGFTTAAFVSSMVLAGNGGLSRGFDVFGDRFADTPGAHFANTLQKRGDQTLAEALKWLEGQRASGRRLFLWLHLYDPHDPYEPPEPYASRFAGRLYDGEVAWSDELVGRLDRALGSLGLSGETLLVIASDHGEGLGEHGETLHGFFVYQTTLAVPFILRGPSIVAGRRLARAVGLVDLYPTILELAGVALPARARPSGDSLAAALRGGAEPPERALYAESLVPLLHFGWSDLRVLRDGRFKYIEAPRPELFDLATDPGERQNLAAGQPGRAQALQAALQRTLDAERQAGAAAPTTGSVPLELLEKLGALGYVGSAVPAAMSGPRADPKDKIAQFRLANELMREALLRLHDGDFKASAARLEELLRHGIESFEAHFYLGRALMGLSRPQEAAPQYHEAVRRAPALVEAWEGWAEARFAAGDPRGAIESLREGHRALPSQPRLLEREAEVWQRLGKREEARRALEAALPLAPQGAALRRRLGELLRDMGAITEAIARLQEAVTLDARDAAAWNSLGMTLGGSGRLSEAESAFRKAIERNDKNHRYAYNLGLALLRLGRAAEARPYFEKTLTLEPGFTPARERLAELARAR